ncbi:MAG: Na(+)-translocating NADH-quinone reductase subunit C [Gammaproteobacteria bacterium]|nr:MAG: Na(+)-translocating NADH-quinone reductase subunit C [Gammaproteobacteria bacterium]
MSEPNASKNKDGLRQTLLVAVLLSLACSVVVATAAVGLRPLQQANKQREIQTKVLEVAGVLDPDEDVAEQFRRLVEPRLVDLRSGRFADDFDPARFDLRKAVRDPALSDPLPPDQDLADIKRRERYTVIYLVKDTEGRLRRVVLPVRGYGLWSTMWGFIALEPDLNTVAGITFYEHGETPGLGGEIANPRWQALWQGKRLYNGASEPRLRVVKGRVEEGAPDAAYKVDGLAGATLTSKGVDNMIRFWFGPMGYQRLLANLREQLNA